MRLYWVRHGQMEGRASRSTDLKAIDGMMGQDDDEVGGLTRAGRLQAERVARHLATLDVRAVYSSPLRRARETAETTASALGLEVRLRDELRELRTGRLRPGSMDAEVVSRIAATRWLPTPVRRVVLGSITIALYYARWRSGRTVGGESRDELHARVDRFIDELRAAHLEGDRVAIFGHGYLLLHLCRRIPARPGAALVMRARPYIANGSVTEIELDGDGLRLVRYAVRPGS